MSEAMPMKAPPWFADGHKTAAAPPAESPSARRRSAMAVDVPGSGQAAVAAGGN